MESATDSDRLDYLYDRFINRIRLRFAPILLAMQHTGNDDAHVLEVVYYLITAGGTAPFEQTPISARMGIHFDRTNIDAVHARADLVCNIILNGIRGAPRS
jgi:hypothetical protein